MNFLLLLSCAAVLLVLRVEAQLPAEMLAMNKFEVANASERGAICNDGSPAVYYFRDCPRPMTECAKVRSEWIVVFEGGVASDSCYNEESCKKRHEITPQKMTSTLAKETLAGSSLDGIFSSSGEGNPNFYMHRTVFVPYCSSDMWLGNSTGKDSGSFAFRGRAIMAAVLEDLHSHVFSVTPVPSQYGPGPNHTVLADAVQVVISGGPGVVAWLDASKLLLPSAADMRGICDGCLLVDVPPLISTTAQPCTDEAATCPVLEVLERGFPFWGATLPPAAAAAARSSWSLVLSREDRGMRWRRLLAKQLLASVSAPLLVQFAQYDTAQLRQSRARVTSAADAAYVQSWAAAVRTLLNARPYTFSAASSQLDSSTLLLDRTGFNFCPVTCQSKAATAAGTAAVAASSLQLKAVASMFLNDYDSFHPVCVDNCGSIDCNKACAPRRQQ